MHTGERVGEHTHTHTHTHTDTHLLHVPVQVRLWGNRLESVWEENVFLAARDGGDITAQPRRWTMCLWSVSGRKEQLSLALEARQAGSDEETVTAAVCDQKKKKKNCSPHWRLAFVIFFYPISDFYFGSQPKNNSMLTVYFFIKPQTLIKVWTKYIITAVRPITCH